MRNVYLDYNATTPVLEDSITCYSETLKVLGNPSSRHQEGQKARVAVENARYSIAQFLNISENRLVFTSSGTESNVTVFYGLCLKKLVQQKPVHIITSTIEHACILNTCEYLESLGASVTYVSPCSKGLISPADVQKAITEHTCVISIMLANNETGTIQPLKDIAKIAHDHKIPCHSDTTQAIGKIPVNIQDLDLDFASFLAINSMHLKEWVA